MGNGIMRFLLVLLALFILCSVSSQIYTSVREEYKTETAVIYSSADKVSFRGVYIRNETAIRKSYSGVLSFPVTDGSKVANGSVVAYVYDSVADIDINRRLNEINEEISLIQAAQNPGTVLTVNPSFVSNLIGEKYQTVSTLLAKKDISDIKAQRDDLLTLMSVYQISIKQETNYDSRIAELQAQAEKLAKSQKNWKEVVESPDAGYFVSYTDGYEGILSLDNADSITAEQIKQVIAGEKSIGESRGNNEIGKLIKGYNWKIAGIINNSDSVYNPGDSVKLSFASTPDTVTAVIEILEPTDDPNEWILVLRCDEMTYDLVQKRVERVEMTLNDFEGIRVSRDALRFNKDNEKGCYVLWGQRVLFKKVDPVFEDEDYILSRITSDENFVCVYDDVIIKGVDTAAFMANTIGTDDDDDSGGGDESEKFEKYSQTASETEFTEPIKFMEDDPANVGRIEETSVSEPEGEDQVE